MGLFGDIGSVIFGESPKAKIGSESTISPEQQAVQRQLSSFFQGDSRLSGGLASSARGAFDEFTDPIVGGLSNLEQLSLAGIEALTSGVTTGEGPEAGVVGGAQSAFTNLLQQGPQDFEEFFQSAIAAPLIEQFKEEILPEISARNASGFFGSERLRQDERVTEDLSEALASSRGQLGFEARENQLNRVVDLLGLTDEVGGAGLGLLERGLAAGRVPRETETARLLSEYEEFLRGQRFDQNLIEQMTRFSAAPTRETVGVGLGGSTGLLGSFLGGFGEGLGGGGGIL